MSYILKLVMNDTSIRSKLATAIIIIAVVSFDIE